MKQLATYKCGDHQFPLELFRRSPAYNPFFFRYHGKECEVGNIKLYNEKGVVVETGHGWFDSLTNSDNMFPSMTFHLFLMRRTKARFDDHSAYFLPHKMQRFSASERGNTPVVVLYLPYDLFHFVVRQWGQADKTRTRIYNYLHYVDRQRNIKIIQHTGSVHTPDDARKFKITRLKAKQRQLQRTQTHLAAQLRTLEAEA